MKQKITVIFLMGVFLLSIFSSFSVAENTISQVKNTCSQNKNEHLDQYTEGTHIQAYKIIKDETYYFSFAQGFKPSLPILTKIRLNLEKTGDLTEDLIVSIRSSLSGDDLVSMSISPNKIFTIPSWITIDFNDINLNVGENYYIVCKSFGGNVDNYYAWHLSPDRRYWKGHVWMYNGEYWSDDDFTNHYFAFETYGYDPNNLQPQISEIKYIDNGHPPQVGKPVSFTVTSTDPNGDLVSYWTDWGDGTVTEWCNPTLPGNEWQIIHVYEEKEKYTISIMAKDTKGAESNWDSYDINIIKSKETASNFLKLIKNFLQMFPLLQKLLQSTG